MRRLLLAASAVLVFGPASANAMSHREYVAYRHCEQGIVKSCIHRAAIHRGVSYDYMLGISWRESRWNPRAVNSSSGAMGLFQWLPSTWRNIPYARRNPFSAKWNALAAAWAMSNGHYSWWAETA